MVPQCFLFLCRLQKLFFHVPASYNPFPLLFLQHLPSLFFSISGPWPDFSLSVLPFPFQFLTQKSVRCAGMLLGHNRSSGGAGEALEKWGESRGNWRLGSFETEHNSYCANFHLHSNSNVMFFPHSWNSLPMVSCWAELRRALGSAWRPALAQGLGGCLHGFELLEGLLGNWWEAEKKVVTSSCNSAGCPYGGGTDAIRFATEEQKGSCWNGNGSWHNRQQCFCWKDSCRGSVRRRGQYCFYRWPLRETLLPLNVLSLLEIWVWIIWRSAQIA